MNELLSTFDAKTWRKVCDEECLPDDHWIREAPRPQGPMGKCGCEWCAATRRYLELRGCVDTGRRLHRFPPQ